MGDIYIYSMRKRKTETKDFVMMAPFRLEALLAKGIRECADKRGCSITQIYREALKAWFANQGFEDPEDVENMKRLAELKQAREAREAAAREQAVRDAEKRLIDHLEHWRRHGGGKPYPFLAGRACPPGFEDVIQGTLGKEEEI